MGRIVTGDETWIHFYELELKLDAVKWYKKGAEPPKGVTVRKLMYCFFGILRVS